LLGSGGTWAKAGALVINAKHMIDRKATRRIVCSSGLFARNSGAYARFGTGLAHGRVLMVYWDPMEKKALTYTLEIERHDDGYLAYSLPGCNT
jgi:hypothetical protein